MDIKILKLITGQELVAYEVSDGVYNKIRQIGLGKEQGQVTLGAWFFFAEGEDDLPSPDIKLNPACISAVVPAPKGIEDIYLQATSTLQLL